MPTPQRRRLPARDKPAAAPARTKPLSSGKPPGRKPATQADGQPRKCAKCQTELEAGSEFCAVCGAPSRVGLKRKRSIADIKQKIQAGKAVRSGQWVLGAVTVVLVLRGLLYYMMSETELRVGAQIIKDADARGISAPGLEQLRWSVNHFAAICFMLWGLPACIFGGLYLWAKQNPFPALVSGLVAYLTIAVVSIVVGLCTGAYFAVFDLREFIVRTFVIISLASAIPAAAAQRRMKERERLEAKQQLAGTGLPAQTTQENAS